MNLLLWIGIPLAYAIIGIVAARVAFVSEMKNNPRIENTSLSKREHLENEYIYESAVEAAIIVGFLWPFAIGLLILAFPAYLIKKFVTAPTPQEKRLNQKKAMEKRAQELEAKERELIEWADDLLKGKTKLR